MHPDKYIDAMKNPEYAKAVANWWKASDEYHKTRAKTRPLGDAVESRKKLYEKLKAGFVCRWGKYAAHFSTNESSEKSEAGAWALWAGPLTPIITADTAQELAASLDTLAPFGEWNFE
jgi:hypothetical protein